MSEEQYDLSKSSKALGKLYPILKDKQGNIIDGFHRQNADPDWPSITVDLVDDPVKLELARLAVNYCRRTIPPSEIENRVKFLVKNGMKPEEIAKATGISERTIYRHLPIDLKDKAISDGTSIAKSVKSEISRQGLTPVKAEMVECERCHIQTAEPKEWHNHVLCSQCEKKANFNPEAYDGYFKMLEREKSKYLPPTKTSPSVESWRDREARMHPQKSKMEEELLLAFGDDTLLRPVQTDKSYPIITLTPDFVFPRHNLAVFVDGKQVHNYRQDRDIELRQQLSDRYGIKVLSVSYESNTETEKQRIIKEIKDAV